MSTSTKPPALRVLHLTRVTNPGARAFARRSAPIEYARQLPGGRPMTFFLDWPTLATTLEAPAKTTDAGLARGIGRMLREALLPSGWAAAEAELLAAL